MSTSQRAALVAPVAPELALVEAADPASDFARAPAPAPGRGRRASCLDGLRGLFLLSMTLGFTIWEKIFPAWMYHRQEPPPTHELVEIAGLTWRDLAYPAFLLTMAAALPITLTLRIDRGATGRDIVAAAMRRGFLLFFFALLIGHSSGYWIGEYTQTSQLLGIAGFVLMFLLFTRRRSDWNPELFGWIRRFAWVAAILFLALTPMLYGKTFSFARRDEILAELAFASVAGSLIWYSTRQNLLARLGALSAVVAVSLAAREEGWVQTLWWASPAPWLFEGDLLKLLLVVIPGTIAGDLLVEWMRAPEADGPPAQRWGRGRLALLAGLGIAFSPILVVGLYNRWVVETTGLVIGLALAGLALVQRPTGVGERLVRQLYLWGVFWLVLGIVLEPFEGGIKKVPGTLSYYFAMGGNALMLLTAMVAVVDLLGKRAWARLLIDVGQNPMICYVIYTVFLNSVLAMIAPVRLLEPESVGEALLRSLFIVALVAVLVQQLTRRRIFWRT